MGLLRRPGRPIAALWLSLSAPPAPVHQVGGKAHGLMRLAEAGFSTPPGGVLTVGFFAPWFFESGAELSLEQAEALDRVRAELGPGAVAVRSSSPQEDTAALSFAGLYRSLLEVEPAELEEAVRACFSSCQSPRVEAYRAEHGLDPTASSFAVVVQRMVEAELAGVAFSVDPVSNDHDLVAISAVRGSAEQVVAGTVTPAELLVSRVDGRVSGPEAQLLSPEQLRAVAQAAVRAEALFGTPVDLEWAIAKGTLFLLQARPITTCVPLHPDFRTEAGAPRRLWVDFSTIEQGLPDPMSVLGCEVYDAFMASFESVMAGVPAEELGHRTKLARGGRVYTDVADMVGGLGRAGTLGVIAGLDPTTAAVLETVDFADYPPVRPKLGALARLAPLAALPRYALGLLRCVVWPEQTAQRARLAIEEGAEAGLSAVDEAAPDALLIPVLRGGLLDTGPELLVAILLCRLAESRIESLLQGAGPELLATAIALRQSLPGNPTVELGVQLGDLAEALPPGDWSPSALVEALGARTLPDAWLNDWEAFLARHGVRGPREIDVAAPRFSEEPERVLEQLLALRGQRPTPREVHEACERHRSKNREALRSWIHAQRGWLAARRFDWWSGLLLSLGGLRESPKFAMVGVVARIRARLLALGRPLVAAGRLDSLDQLFDLQLAQLVAGLRDEDLDLPGLAAENRRLPDQLARLPALPTVIDSRGRIPRAPPSDPADPAVLVGTAVSPGVARGRVRLLDTSTMALAPGEVLVARATDPGWTPLFPVAAAIVLEVGGPMQHGALVAREYGKPCVVAVPGCTTRLQEGEWVEVDGGAGTVRRITG